MKIADKILFYGFGNIGRQDDGVGIILTDQLRALDKPNYCIEQNFQLNAEDAHTISLYPTVVFIDARVNCETAFSCARLEALDEIEFSTHAMHPQSILSLCQNLYQQKPTTYLLTIAAYEFAFEQELTANAKNNMEQALSYINEHFV